MNTLGPGPVLGGVVYTAEEFADEIATGGITEDDGLCILLDAEGNELGVWDWHSDTHFTRKVHFIRFIGK